MGEQLICKLNPTSDIIKKQLSQLRDQWQTLKQTAANQTRALGGVKNLQDFNKKVEKLEAWIKDKVKKTTITNIPLVFCYAERESFSFPLFILLEIILLGEAFAYFHNIDCFSRIRAAWDFILLLSANSSTFQ